MARRSPRAGDARPGARAAGRTGHPPVELPPREPGSEGKLQIQEREDADSGHGSARRADDGEQPALWNRIGGGYARRRANHLRRGGRRREQGALSCGPGVASGDFSPVLHAPVRGSRLAGRSPRLRLDWKPEERPLPEWVGAVGHYRKVPAGTPVSRSVRASSRYASAPCEVGACWRIDLPRAGASAKRIDFRTGGWRTGRP